MGIDYNLYVGPYLKVPAVLMERPKQIRNCSKDMRHKVQSTHKFCPECGALVQLVTQTLQINGYPQYWDLEDCAGFVEDAFFTPVEGVWLPNQGKFGKHLDLKEEDNSILAIPDEAEQQQAKNRLVARYPELFEAFINKYGGIPLEVCFGIIYYTN